MCVGLVDRMHVTACNAVRPDSLRNTCNRACFALLFLLNEKFQDLKWVEIWKSYTSCRFQSKTPVLTCSQLNLGSSACNYNSALFFSVVFIFLESEWNVKLAHLCTSIDTRTRLSWVIVFWAKFCVTRRTRAKQTADYCVSKHRFQENLTLIVLKE